MPEPTTADVLRVSRELYARAPSHALPRDYPEPGTVCAVTAVSRAVDRAVPRIAARPACHDRACDALRTAVDSESHLAAWNAENSTETVLAAFDRAIEAQS